MASEVILGILVLLERLSLCEEIQVILAFEGHQVILGHEDNREPEALQGAQEERAQRALWGSMAHRVHLVLQDNQETKVFQEDLVPEVPEVLMNLSLIVIQL